VRSSKGRSGKSVSGDYFRELYRDKDDPWGYADSPYERAKYEATLDALPRRRYRRALELACSIGVFTEMLASRCDELLAIDVSEDALARAARRCAGLSHVRLAAFDLTWDFPTGPFDLVTFCEAGFYFGPRDLARIREAIARTLQRSGGLVLVHWTPLVQGHAQTADEVHEAFIADPRFTLRAGARAKTYRLDVLSRQ
jgi:SAM-dependent methyltransferase